MPGRGLKRDAIERVGRMGIKLPDSFETGGIVGWAELVDCVTHYDSPFFSGPVGFVLRDASTLPFFPCTGKLGFFEVTIPVASA